MRVFTSKQEVFDHVYSHFIKQGCRAINQKNGCEYRTLEGHKCAAGCFVPDSRYQKEFEGSYLDEFEYISNSISYTILDLLGNDKELYNLVHRFQRVHDNGLTYHDMMERYREIANEEELVVPEP